MCKCSLKILVSALTVNMLIYAVPSQFSMAQPKSLPRSGFSNYMNRGASLPSGSGLHLQEGADRPAGAPAEVYNPGEPKLGHKLVRWLPQHMPLRVWISPGKKLPEEPISVINAQRPNEVLNLLMQDPASLLALPQCQGWTPDMNTAAKTGIEQWREFQNEGLFSFEFVDDPALANIFLFWAERFSGDEGVGGVSTGGNTVAVLYDLSQVRAKEASLGRTLQNMPPVIIELQTRQDSFEQLQARAAHEFGHALGIKEHSPYNQDLMCVNGIAKMLSASDKATIRWLYRQSTPYVMMPTNLQKTSTQIAGQQHAVQESGPGAWADGASGGQARYKTPEQGQSKAAASSGGGYRIGDLDSGPDSDSQSQQRVKSQSGREKPDRSSQVSRSAAESETAPIEHHGSPAASSVRDFVQELEGKKPKKKEKAEKKKKEKNSGKQNDLDANSGDEANSEPPTRASDGF